MFKKAAIATAFACLFAVMAAGAAMADTIGCVEFQKCLMQHPKFAQVQNQMRSASEKKQQEARTAIEAAKDDKSKSEIFQKKRGELAQEERNLIQPIYKEIDLAIRTIAKNKNITVVLEKDATFTGGIDITQDVIGQLKK